LRLVGIAVGDAHVKPEAARPKDDNRRALAFGQVGDHDEDGVLIVTVVPKKARLVDDDSRADFTPRIGQSLHRVAQLGVRCG
jgi:hypothetical protein